MQYKLKHRLSAALMAGAMCCTMIPLPRPRRLHAGDSRYGCSRSYGQRNGTGPFADHRKSVQRFAGCTYRQLPRQHGSACGNRRDENQHFSAWGSDLYDGADAHMDADALNADESNITVGKTPDANYAVVPLLVQTEYRRRCASAEVVLPEAWSFSATRPPTA